MRRDLDKKKNPQWDILSRSLCASSFPSTFPTHSIQSLVSLYSESTLYCSERFEQHEGLSLSQCDHLESLFFVCLPLIDHMLMSLKQVFGVWFGIMLRLAGNRTYGDSPWTTWSGIWCIVTFQALSVAHLKIQYRKYFRKISSANYYLVTYILFPYLVFPVQEGIITTYHTWGRK